MSSVSAQELQGRLAAELPGVLAPPREPRHEGNGAATAHRPGHKGEAGPPDLLATADTVVLPERIADVAHYLLETLGYGYLSNITAVDYLADGLIEVVYHFYHLDGGPALVIKTRVAREHPVLPSLTPFWPGADFQEREAYDLYGVRFAGHPDLRRIYMWEEFEGFPMRKDFPKQGDKYIEEE